MKRNTRFMAAALLVAFMGTTLIAPLAARASEEGKRNTTYALGALSAALLLTQKNKLPGLLAAGGAVYAYSELQKDINRRHERERVQSYRTGYRRGVTYTKYHRANTKQNYAYNRYARR